MKKLSLKKAAALLTAAALLISAFACFGCVSAKADSHYVSMYLSDMYYFRHGEIDRNIYVKTDANANNQQVFIHYQNSSDPERPWEDEEAEFMQILPDGSKLWKANVESQGYCTRFVVKYIADGVEMWDNNNGNDYETYPGGAIEQCVVLGSAPVAVDRSYSPCPLNPGTNVIPALVQNYAYEKNVFIRYTNDGWNTYTDSPMSYDSTMSDGTEKWTGTLEFTASDYSDFEYCIGYRVNGQEYWGNNFGSNYGYSYCVGH